MDPLWDQKSKFTTKPNWWYNFCACTLRICKVVNKNKTDKKWRTPFNPTFLTNPFGFKKTNVTLENYIFQAFEWCIHVKASPHSFTVKIFQDGNRNFLWLCMLLSSWKNSRFLKKWSISRNYAGEMWPEYIKLLRIIQGMILKTCPVTLNFMFLYFLISV